MSKEAIKLQADIVNATAKLYELGFRIQCNYIYGAGWASEIININEMEQIELESESRNVTPETIVKDWSGESFQDDYQAKLDAEQEKNNDYAIDNMTCDDEMVIDDVGQMYDPTERLKMEEE